RLPLAAGDAATVFAKPESVVLSETTARKYFGDRSPIGKTITLSGQTCDDTYQNCRARQQVLVVTGILRDLPHNTQFKADLMMPNTSSAAPINKEMKESWVWINSWGYVRLAPGADPNVVLAKYRRIIDRALDADKRVVIKVRGSDFLAPYLTPL